MRIAFLGTPDFAIPTLSALIDSEHDIVAVITQPDKPRGRKGTPTPCVTKQFAMDNGLDVYSFARIRLPENVQTLKDLAPDIMVTAAYGQILTQEILDIPKLGCVNVHGSLLPKYRGAAPIQMSIIMGEKTTGITTMLTERGVDCGDILLQRELPIGDDMTAGQLFDELATLGAQVLIDTLKGIEDGSITPQPQNHDEATHYPMFKKQDGKIDWSKSAQDIHNLVRGVNPWPGAFTTHNDTTIKIWKTKLLDTSSNKEVGTILASDNTLDIACGEGTIRVLEMQIPGKKRMATELVLRGYKLAVDDRLI